MVKDNTESPITFVINLSLTTAAFFSYNEQSFSYHNHIIIIIISILYRKGAVVDLFLPMIGSIQIRPMGEWYGRCLLDTGHCLPGSTHTLLLLLLQLQPRQPHCHDCDGVAFFLVADAWVTYWRIIRDAHCPQKKNHTTLITVLTTTTTARHASVSKHVFQVSTAAARTMKRSRFEFQILQIRIPGVDSNKSGLLKRHRSVSTWNAGFRAWTVFISIIGCGVVWAVVENDGDCFITVIIFS